VADIPDDGRVSRRSLLIGTAGAAAVVGIGAVGFDHELDRHPGLRTRIFGCGSTPAIPASRYTSTTGTYASAAMHAAVPWEVALPTDPAGERLPLVVVLPGAGGQPHDMIDRIGLPGWATANHLTVAFASPGGAGSTYYHPRADGTDAFAWVTEEFIPMVEERFDVGGARASRAIFGVSMGGFGSLLVAQRRPDLVCAAVGSSPAVFSSYRAAVTGHPGTFDSAADWQRWGLWNQLQTMGRVPVRVDCGSGDPFAPTARQLLTRIPGAVGHIGSGCHDDGFWRRKAPTQLQFLASHLAM
jgi:S-formylglutathione hydrolase FrmB